MHIIAIDVITATVIVTYVNQTMRCFCGRKTFKLDKFKLSVQAYACVYY